MATNKVYASPGAITAFSWPRLLPSRRRVRPRFSGPHRTRRPVTDESLPFGTAALARTRCDTLGDMRTQWNATAGNGDELRLYIVQADAAADPTQTDGGITFGDADTTNENPLLYNALYLGCIMSNGTSHPESTSGLVYLSGRYVGVAAWNGAGSQGWSIRPTTTCSPLPNFPMKSRRHHKWVQTKSTSSPARQRSLPPLA